MEADEPGRKDMERGTKKVLVAHVPVDEGGNAVEKDDISLDEVPGTGAPILIDYRDVSLLDESADGDVLTCADYGSFSRQGLTSLWERCRLHRNEWEEHSSHDIRCSKHLHRSSTGRCWYQLR